MKYANFLMFGFLLAFSQSSFSQGYETAYSCAQILVYGQEYTDFEDERFDRIS